MSKVSPNKNSAKTRLSKLRRLLSLSQREFSQSIGITQGALSQLETGKSSLSMETIRKISEIFNVDCNWLVKGDGGAFLSESDSSRVTEMHHTVITRNERNQALIPLINEEARAGYLKNCKDLEYLSTLDVYRIPGFEEGDYRLFEIEGDSMIPTIYPREIVVAENKPQWNEIENGKICIVISAEGIIAKRVYFYDEDRSQLILKSDNAKFKTYSLPMKDIMEIWEVRAKITNVFAQEHLMHARKMEMLELDLNELKEQVKRLSGGAAEAEGKTETRKSSGSRKDRTSIKAINVKPKTAAKSKVPVKAKPRIAQEKVVQEKTVPEKGAQESGKKNRR